MRILVLFDALDDRQVRVTSQRKSDSGRGERDVFAEFRNGTSDE